MGTGLVSQLECCNHWRYIRRRLIGLWEWRPGGRFGLPRKKSVSLRRRGILPVELTYGRRKIFARSFEPGGPARRYGGSKALVTFYQMAEKLAHEWIIPR